MDKPTVHIDDWYILDDNLYGHVQDHPRFEKGVAIRSSTIVGQPVLLAHPGDIVETRNTKYVLGTEFKKPAEERQ